MIFKKIYSIENWTEWTKILNDAIKDFKKAFSFNPNIMLANKHTFSQINFFS